MLVKDVLKIAITYLQLDECLDSQALGGTTISPSTAITEKLNLLTKCLNLSVNEIANENLHLLFEETVTANNNSIAFSSLTKNAINIKKIETLFGSEVDFKIFNSNIKVNNGTYKIMYNYSPEDVELTSTSICETFDGKISPKTLAYGICKEYCLITGLFDEAVMWNEQFQQSIQIACRNKNNVFLKKRRWF